MSAGGFTVGLGTVEAAKRVHGVDSTPGAAAMAVVFWTDDVDTAYARLVAAGAQKVTEPHDVGNNNRNALFAIPTAISSSSSPSDREEPEQSRGHYAGSPVPPAVPRQGAQRLSVHSATGFGSPSTRSRLTVLADA
jgi:hypothetical protein